MTTKDDGLFASDPGVAHPDAPIPNVIQLRPDGITIRNESPQHWLSKRRGGIQLSETAYDLGELYELREVLSRYLEQFK